ncbi:hypothetical protein PVNG_03814 [Plasmodium vivax North Korean]|uniref:Uncharacterized protein n=1 Tax=Plasmodium vivax North Korean TaxID=1035514 RepID=A0A0J9TST0_PLAVI|nr:hypothetical protein PVNG_03814 [Plasmodium vivax North Korean]
MSGNITYIEDWKQEYPILENIWNTYDKFDKTVDQDSKKNNYYLVCYYIIDRLKGDTEEHEKFCMKLVRNLGFHSDNYDFLNYKSKRCLNLNNWIYNSMKKHNIRENIITKCFDEYNYHMNRIGKDPTCLYYEYEKTYAEPMNIIILNIFESNIHVIIEKLESEIDSIRCSCQKYVNKIVEIYKYMKKTHCPYDKIFQKTETCQRLDKFKISYDEYLYNEEKINNKIPSLENNNLAFFSGCVFDGSAGRRESAENFEAHEQVEANQGLKYVRSDRSPNPFETTQEKQSDDTTSSMSRTVSTAIGTVAGTSSLLAMLYKVNKKYY